MWWSRLKVGAALHLFGARRRNAPERRSLRVSPNVCPRPLTSNIRLFKSFKSQRLTVHTGLLCPPVQAGLCPGGHGDKGTWMSTPTVRRRIIMSGHGVCQRSEVRGRVLIIMRSLCCQQLCNKAGRDRRMSTFARPGGGWGVPPR